ncbi:MAG: DMT family transporter [Epibacterium sp.]
MGTLRPRLLRLPLGEPERTDDAMTHETPQNPPLAAALILLATVFIAGTTLLAKSLGTEVLGPPLHALQISQGRFAFAFIGISAAVVALRQKIHTPHWGLHIGRSSFGWGGVTLMFASVAFIPLADATAISFLNPVIGMILAIPFLGEKVGPWRWLAAAIALLGAMVLLRPTPASFQPAALLAFGAALAMGAELIFIKTLAAREPLLQILWVNNLIGMVIASTAALAVWQMPTPAQWAALVALGALMACAQACFVNAMARADASFVAPFAYATLVFAALYDALIFGVLPDWVTVLGAGIILSGAGLLAWRESVNGKRPLVTEPQPRSDTVL